MVNLDFYKDFAEQPACFRRHRKSIQQIPEEIRETIKEVPVLTGIATSLSAWRGAYSLLGTQRQNMPLLINTGDLLDYCIPQSEDSRPVVVMSRSGDSAEIVRLMEEMPKERCVTGITEGANSALARRSNLLLQYFAGERAFPNTISFTLSQLYALGVVIGLGYHPSVSLEELLGVLEERSQELCQSLDVDEQFGKTLAKASAVIVEGQGYLTGIAEQYALDFHETRTAGVLAVGGIMRHGIIELTEKPGVVTLMLIPNDLTAERKFRLAKELTDQKKTVIILTDADIPKDCKADVLRIPSAPVELKSILFTLGMQKIYGSYISQKSEVLLQPALVGKVTRKE